MRTESMVIQGRDRELLLWINGFGFVELVSVAGRWGVVYETARARVRKLVDAGLLARERVLFGGAMVLKVTTEGIEVAGDDLGPVKGVRLGTLEHDLAVVRLAVRLERETGGVFEPERRLRRRLGLAGVGVPGHVPDGLLRPPGAEKPIAVEVELSAKPKARLRQIIDQYRTSFDYSGVWYFVGGENIKRQVEDIAGGDSFFRVEMLNDCKS